MGTTRGHGDGRPLGGKRPTAPRASLGLPTADRVRGVDPPNRQWPVAFLRSLGDRAGTLDGAPQYTKAQTVSTTETNVAELIEAAMLKVGQRPTATYKGEAGTAKVAPKDGEVDYNPERYR